MKLTVKLNYEGCPCDKIYEKNPGEPLIGIALFGGVPTPAVIGKDFTGWSYDPEGNRKVDPEKDVAQEDGTIYAQWQEWDEETARYMERCEKLIREMHYVIGRPSAYTKESFDAYQTIAAPLSFLTMGAGSEVYKNLEGLFFALEDASKKLIPAPGVEDPEETVWYIWNEQMAEAPEAAQYEYWGTWDSPGFRPFLVPYLLPDQSTVKGNLILISGGGYMQRANRWEAYPAIEEFLQKGYNVFVLQRRVAPSNPIDCSLDLQRAIRYLRFYAEEKGIAKPENIAAAGYSGGGVTINRQVESLYGTISPSSVYSEYKDDEIDKENADLQAMLLIYSAQPLVTDNSNIPDAFVVIGVNDQILYEDSYKAMKYYKENGLRFEAHFFSDAGHGFGNGFGLNYEKYYDEIVENVKIWPQLADTFMQISFGQLENTTPIPGA